MAFPGLTPAVFSRHTETAQRFLASAYDSVEDLLENQDAQREMADDDLKYEPALGARTAESAQDLLRAAIVFAAAGLDAALKQLIRDALVPILLLSKDAGEKFQNFAELAIDTENPTGTKRLARYLTSPDPRAALIETYVYELTGSSLQSVEQVNRAMGALGLNDPDLRRRTRELRPLFDARNQIVHELDLLQPGGHGDRHRRSRDLQASVELAHLALDFGQQIINGVVGLLSE